MRTLGEPGIGKVVSASERTKIRPSGKTKTDHTSYFEVDGNRFYMKKKLRIGLERPVLYVLEPRKNIILGTKDDSLLTLMWKQSRIFIPGGLIFFGLMATFTMAMSWIYFIGEFIGFGDMEVAD